VDRKISMEKTIFADHFQYLQLPVLVGRVGRV
jgi:hypothetical protein